MTFAFAVQEGETLTLSEAVGQAIRAASVCWEDMSGTGVFDDARAREIAGTLEAFVKNLLTVINNQRTQVAVDKPDGQLEVFDFMATHWTHEQGVVKFWANAGNDEVQNIAVFQVQAGRIAWICVPELMNPAKDPHLALATTRQLLDELEARGDYLQDDELRQGAAALLESTLPAELDRQAPWLNI